VDTVLRIPRQKEDATNGIDQIIMATSHAEEESGSGSGVLCARNFMHKRSVIKGNAEEISEVPQ